MSGLTSSSPATETAVLTESRLWERLLVSMVTVVMVVSLQVVVVAGVLLTPLAYVEWRCGWCGGGEVAGALQLAFYHSPKLACY